MAEETVGRMQPPERLNASQHTVVATIVAIVSGLSVLAALAWLELLTEDGRCAAAICLSPAICPKRS